MSILEAIILGIIQGLTEFIPVSSSGHLVIMQEFLGVSAAGLGFDVALHIGTLLALFVYFRKDILLLIGGILGRNEYRKVSWLIVFATVPATIGGIILHNAAETTFRSVRLVLFNLMFVGFLMIAAERFSKRYADKARDIRNVTVAQALIVGFAQVLALVPGVSRSGSTITAGLFVGMERVAATRFSFLLAIPITFGAILKVMFDGTNMEQFTAAPAVFTAGIVSALVSGLFAIRFLIRFLAHSSLRPFAYYRIGLALAVLAVLSIR